MKREGVLALAAALLMGCGGGDPVDTGDAPANLVTVDGVRYGAAVAVMESFPVQVVANVTLTNVSGAAVDVSFPDGCVVLLQATRPGENTPVWEQEAGCTMAIVEVTLPRGESRSFSSATVSARDILGSRLPDGDYAIQAVIRPLGEARLVLQTGTVKLAIPRN